MKNQSDVVIVDYGVGNLFNIQRAFEAVGVTSQLSNDPATITGANRLLLPGVGAFEAGMSGLRAHGLIETIREYSKIGRPLMGICLGMQLLVTESEELGTWPGLDIIAGDVRALSRPRDPREVLKIPHIGWSALSPRNGDPTTWSNTILEGLTPGTECYFVHSYHVRPDEQARLAMTDYGDNHFCSVLQRGHISGCQFHPERSGEAGLKILRNFASL